MISGGQFGGKILLPGIIVTELHIGLSGTYPYFAKHYINQHNRIASFKCNSIWAAGFWCMQHQLPVSITRCYYRIGLIIP